MFPMPTDEDQKNARPRENPISSDRLEHRIRRTTDLVKRLYETVAELENLFPGRRFTPDGHLVGSLGEALAADRYGLKLLPASTEGHDAHGPDGRLVQIKATQRSRVSLYSKPEHLIVLQLTPDGQVEEIYNGPGEPAWKAAGKPQKNGQCAILATKLRTIMESIPAESRLPTLRYSE